MVGSSSSSTSGRANSTAASATRIRQPPENSAQALACAAASNPSPFRIDAARASAECASMSASRAWISAIRCASVAASASAISAARSTSASSTVSIRLSRVAGASCATPPIRARFGTSISPASSASSPRISRNSVVLPLPFRPTNPTLCPAGISAEASSKSFLPSIEKLMLRIASMRRDVARAPPRLSTRAAPQTLAGSAGANRKVSRNTRARSVMAAMRPESLDLLANQGCSSTGERGGRRCDIACSPRPFGCANSLEQFPGPRLHWPDASRRGLYPRGGVARSTSRSRSRRRRRCRRSSDIEAAAAAVGDHYRLTVPCLSARPAPSTTSGTTAS